jgi:hypothetical protein
MKTRKRMAGQAESLVLRRVPGAVLFVYLLVGRVQVTARRREWKAEWNTFIST